MAKDEDIAKAAEELAYSIRLMIEIRHLHRLGAKNESERMHIASDRYGSDDAERLLRSFDQLDERCRQRVLRKRAELRNILDLAEPTE